MKIILELILLNVHMTSHSQRFCHKVEVCEGAVLFFFFFCQSSAMCSIVCSVGYSQNTLEGKETTPHPLLLASANLRKYNHSLLLQFPAEMQTQAVSRRALQTLQRASVSIRATMK